MLSRKGSSGTTPAHPGTNAERLIEVAAPAPPGDERRGHGFAERGHPVGRPDGAESDILLTLGRGNAAYPHMGDGMHYAYAMRDAPVPGATAVADAAPPVRLRSVQVAHPNHRVTQAETVALLGRVTGEYKRLAALARGSAIRQRAVVLPPEQLLHLGGAGARNAVYWAEAPTLALRAARLAMIGPLERVTCLATSSCTGFHLPGVGVELQSQLGLPARIRRIPLTDPGCAGGVVAIGLAAEQLAARPNSGTAALAVAVELCSLSLHHDVSRGSLTAALIFADGAGAALLEEGPGPGLRIVDTASLLVPASQGLLGFELNDGGFSPVLERELVDVLPPQMHSAVATLLHRNGLAPGDVAAWLIHPGGARILRRLERCLAMPEGSTRWSWDSLGEYGNTSSAAIFDVLRRYLEDGPRRGEWAIVAGFGPGVAIELLLLQAC